MGWDHVKVLENRINTLEEKVSTIKQDVTNVTMKLEAPSSIIKSIQRGTGSGNTTITINEINPEKTIILIEGGNGGGGSTNGVKISDSSAVPTSTACPVVTKLTSTSFTIGNASYSYLTTNYGNLRSEGANVSYSWQVIEFY